MSLALAAVLLLSSADDAEIAKALRNLARMHEIAQVLEMRSVAQLGTPADVPPDSWGTPYRIIGMRVISAGSDRKFEEGEYANEQFTGTEGDAVFDHGMFRSNRNWLVPQAKSDDAAAALNELRKSEMLYMMLRGPLMRDATLAMATVRMLQDGGKTVDAWGTPLRIEGTRVISAGADRTFDPMSWNRPPALNENEDIIAENGKVIRSVDMRALLDAHPLSLEAVPQPADAPLEGERPGGGVKAPVALTRVEPQYPRDYRTARIEGIVIVEARIGADGSVGEVHLRKSVAPELDAAAIDAVKQWTFQPGTRDGVPVPVVFVLTISFRLK